MNSAFLPKKGFAMSYCEKNLHDRIGAWAQKVVSGAYKPNRTKKLESIRADLPKAIACTLGVLNPAVVIYLGQDLHIELLSTGKIVYHT